MEYPYDPKSRKNSFLLLAMFRYLELVAEDFKAGKIKEVEISVKEVKVESGKIQDETTR